ncbi:MULTISPECIES: hypothetical protein [Paenibacillus]|uniref:Uncharacterized protein n=1 Tax=Paenibacillus albilobatus TaxID=2716884 RepID=A0A919XHN0_9BACL|nr:MULTISPECIES: hypothetical protein [Paenibacillus]GIO31110.1 hypothetical protein J2TS6_22510 [Paenibacillus albilobatus]
MKKRTLIYQLLIGACLLGGCSGSSGPGVEVTFTPNEAIAKAVRESRRTDFPGKAGEIAGIIKGGGPSPGIRVPGSFISSAEKLDDSAYLVTLTEKWSAKDFRTEGAAPDGDLSYSWQYEVSPSEVKLVQEGGDFPPQHVE